MNESVQRQRRAMRRAVVRGVLIVAVFALGSPFAVSAQATTTPPRATRPLLLAGAETSRPLHEAATVGTVIALRPLKRGSDFTSGLYSYRGVVLEAAVGVEGYGLAAGWGQRMKAPGGPVFYGTDIMATWFRTQKWAAAERVSATYMGAEVGVPLFIVPMTRLSLGAARRVSGPETVDRTIFTWGIGVLVGG
jgi:hypothetical protein